MPQFEGEISVDGKIYKIKGEFNMAQTATHIERSPETDIKAKPVEGFVIDKQKIIRTLTGRVSEEEINKLLVLIDEKSFKITSEEQKTRDDRIAESLKIISANAVGLYGGSGKSEEPNQSP